MDMFLVPSLNVPNVPKNSAQLRANLRLSKQRRLGYGPLVGCKEQDIRAGGVHLVGLSRVNRLLPKNADFAAESLRFLCSVKSVVPFPAVLWTKL